MQRVVSGIVRGATIELERDPELPEGSRVEVLLRSVPTTTRTSPAGNGTTAAGMMAEHWTPDDDRILDEIQQDRKRDSRREPEA